MDALDQLMEEIIESRIAAAREEGRIVGRIERRIESSKKIAAALLNQGGLTISNKQG